LRAAVVQFLDAMKVDRQRYPRACAAAAAAAANTQARAVIVIEGNSVGRRA
jgi:hypothetical protein